MLVVLNECLGQFDAHQPTPAKPILVQGNMYAVRSTITHADPSIAFMCVWVGACVLACVRACVRASIDIYFLWIVSLYVCQ